MNHWLTVTELLGLPGLPGSAYRLREKLRELGVPSRKRTGVAGGGGDEFDASALPAATQRALLTQRVADTPNLLPAATAARAVVNRTPTRQESAVADARTQLVRRVLDDAELMGGTTAATEALAARLASADAEPGLLAAASAANQRARDVAHISARSLFRWVSAYRDGGWWALLPAPQSQPSASSIAPDVAAVLKAYSSTHGAARNLTHVAQRITDELGRPFDDWRRLYDQARRALPKLDKTQLIKARHTAAERASKLPFKRRDTSTLRPLDVAVCDGHTAKVKVRHPVHGAPFAPEITVVLDAATRMITGWSLSLSESQIAVGSAVRHAVSQFGIPSLLYSDNGGGQANKSFDCPIAGLFARLGTEHRTGIPGHPQGHGLIERSWQTHMIRVARQFGAYQGRDVDDRTLRNVTLELAREQRAVKRAGATGELVRLSSKVPSWQLFSQAVQDAVDHYNLRHRHRSLPKHTSGPDAGKHMTPREAWDAMLVPEDQVMLDAPSLRALFMPSVLRVAQRGEVRWLNTTYFSTELMDVDGQQVRVDYDLHDARRVWIWTVDGRFVCEADAQANRMGYFPAPVIERAREKRVMGIVKRREAQIETAMRELTPTLPAPAHDVITVEEMQQALAPTAELAPVMAGTRPTMFDSAADRYEWLMQHRSAWSDEDRQWLSAYAGGDDYLRLRDYFASRAIAWDGEDDTAFKRAG